MSSSGVTRIILTRKRIVGRKKSPSKNSQNKFEQLYENYKTRQVKNEKLKQKILSEREKKHLTECTFSPKTNKYKNIFNKKPFDSYLKGEALKNETNTKKKLLTDSNIQDWIDKQNEWLENKNNKLNKRIVTETMKDMEKYVFEPQIQKTKKRTISNLKIEAHKIIEKPDYYLNYIKKKRQFIKNKSNSRLYEYPISGDWKSPYKKNKLRINRMNDYDYTKHQLMERSYMLKNKSSSNFNNNISMSISNKSFNSKEKERKTITVSKLKINNLKGDELYKIVYLREKEKLNRNIKDYTEENLEKIFQGKDKIHFKQALERLHTVLIDLNLDNMKENENERNLINGNYNSNDNKEIKHNKI